MTAARKAALLRIPEVKDELRQHRTIIVERLRQQIFRQIAENDEVILTYFEEFLAKMTENLQANADKARRALIVRCCLKTAERLSYNVGNVKRRF